LNHREIANERSQQHKRVTTLASNGTPVCTCKLLFAPTRSSMTLGTLSPDFWRTC
jgi:hypothetical protein